MKERRHVPAGVLLRLTLGAGLGIFGLGQMGESTFPFHPLAFSVGVVLLAAGAFMAIGLTTTRGSG